MLLRLHLCTAERLLAHLCKVVLIGSMRRALCSKLFMMGALRPIYKYVQLECSAEPSIGRTLCDWGVFHLSSSLANDFWSPCKFSALTTTPLYSSTPTSTSLYSGINRLYAQNPVFEIVHDESVKAYLHICTAGMFSRTFYWKEPYGTEALSISPRFSPMTSDPCANSLLLRAHLCTAVLLLVHLCTAVLRDSMHRSLYSKLSMMGAWRPNYTYVQ